MTGQENSLNVSKKTVGVLDVQIADVCTAFGVNPKEVDIGFIAQSLRDKFPDEKPQFILTAIENGMTGKYGNYGKPNLITIGSWIWKEVIERNKSNL